jgi:hypothetical protein
MIILKIIGCGAKYMAPHTPFLTRLVLVPPCKIIALYVLIFTFSDISREDERFLGTTLK